MSELKLIFPEPEVIMVQGRRVVVRPVRLRDFETFGVAAAGLIEMVANATPVEVYAYAKKSGALPAILRTCTDLNAWRISRLPAAAAVELMLLVVAINNRFFDQALVRAGNLLAGAMLSRG